MQKRNGAALFLCAVTVVGCGEIPTALENITETTHTIEAQEPKAKEQGPGPVKSTWVFDDGLKVTLVSLKRGTVPQIAAGGNPGDPAVIVKVKIKNDSDSKIDVSQMSIDVRVGADGDSTQQTFTGDSSNPEGTLAKGRSYTHEAMFAAKSGFKKVAVDVAPTWNHTPALFEDELK